MTQLHLGRLPDGGLAPLDGEPMVKDVVRHLRAFRPDVVITFGPDGRGDRPDHLAIGRIALETFRRCGSGTHHPEHAGLGLHPWAPSRLYETAMPRSAADQFGWPDPTFPTTRWCASTRGASPS